MAIRSSVRRRKRVAFWVLLVLSIVWMLPLVWAIGTSFKSAEEITNNVLGIIPMNATFKNYQDLFADVSQYPILRWMANSFIIASLHTALYLVIASAAAYAFSILRWKYRNLVFGILITTMMIPSVANIIPLFSMVVNFGWLNDGWRSFLALIIPGLGGVFGLFIIRQFFINIPREVVESARIDGLSDLGIFFRIIFPLGKSALMVAGLFAFMGSWNDYLWPSIIGSVVMNPNFLTLQTGLASMQSSNNYEYGKTMAAAIISIIPVIIVYMFVQDKIIEGVSHTGLKG